MQRWGFLVIRDPKVKKTVGALELPDHFSASRKLLIAFAAISSPLNR
jgi:hypothetical protein